MRHGVSKTKFERRAAYIHMWPVVVIHGHRRELGANVDHRSDEEIHYRVVVRNACHSFLYEFEADPALVLYVP